eukprot:206964-Rhodomonas_salina.2
MPHSRIRRAQLHLKITRLPDASDAPALQAAVNAPLAGIDEEQGFDGFGGSGRGGGGGRGIAASFTSMTQ